MLGHGNCPKCEKPVTHCALDEIGVSDKLIGSSFHGIAMWFYDPNDLLPEFNGLNEGLKTRAERAQAAP